LQKWVDEHFHLLDNVVLCRRGSRSKRPPSTGKPDTSSFTWNEVVFRSFQAGHLKQIDLDFYRQLSGAIAKRMYRFLDKRFHFSVRLALPLATFAREKLGLSRSYDSTQLKRRLEPAIEELEQTGFLIPMPAAERYRRIRRGQWQVVFIRRPKSRGCRVGRNAATRLADDLVRRGVSAQTAEELVRKFSPSVIEEKLRGFDRLRTGQTGKSLKNPAGFLVQAIRNDYCLELPSTTASHLPIPEASSGSTSKTAGARETVTPESDRRHRQLCECLSRLSLEEIERLEEQALARASRIVVDGYRRAKANGHAKMCEHYRLALLEPWLGKQSFDGPPEST
jgi:hypothetical protein